MIDELNRIIEFYVERQKIPGAVLTIIENGITTNTERFGYKSLIPEREKMEIDDIFDVASLTKVIATWSSVMHMIDTMNISLDLTLGELFGDRIKNKPVKDITISNLLNHSSGFSIHSNLIEKKIPLEIIIEEILNNPLLFKPGCSTVYSNRNYILLGEIIKVITNYNVEEYSSKYIWTPLEMKDTMFNPNTELIKRVVPTEFIEGVSNCKRGVVHDENALYMGGISGHAGVFSTIKDLTNFCIMICNDGYFNSKKVLDKKLIQKSLKAVNFKLGGKRGLCWDIIDADCGYYVGHTGFTGTSIYLNKRKKNAIILLTNSVHPNRSKQKNANDLRREIRETSNKFSFL